MHVCTCTHGRPRTYSKCNSHKNTRTYTLPNVRGKKSKSKMGNVDGHDMQRNNQERKPRKPQPRACQVHLRFPPKVCAKPPIPKHLKKAFSVHSEDELKDLEKYICSLKKFLKGGKVAPPEKIKNRICAMVDSVSEPTVANCKVTFPCHTIHSSDAQRQGVKYVSAWTQCPE